MAYLCITLLIMLCTAYYINDKELIAPAVLFNLSFFLASLFAWINQKKWLLYLSKSTYLVIVLGILEYILISYFIKFLFRKKVPVRDGNNIKIYSSNRRLNLVILIQLINIGIIYHYSKQVTGMTSFQEISYSLNMASVQGNEEISLPQIATVLNIINMAIGYWGEYCFSKNTIYKEKKNRIQYIVIAIMGMFSPFMGGYRGSTIYLIIALIVYFLLFIKNKYKKVKIKYLFMILLLVAILISLFQLSATLVGRDVSSLSPFEYISMYIGAEIKNLDIFIRNGMFPVKNEVFGRQTFASIIPTISKILNLNLPRYRPILPFQSVNGYSLGNVYTTFYPWLYDFGYIGIFLMTILASSITQIIYELSKKNIEKKAVSVSTLLYGYIASLVFLSFFSNKLFENFNTSLVYMIIVWLILNKFVLIKSIK